jgi:gliding motility-associated-like protein
MLFSNSASPQVIADFTTSSGNNGCGSLVVDFQDLSTGAPDAWLWDFGNGNSSTLKNPTAIYTNPGLFDVILIASNSLTNDSKTSIGAIEVFNSPISEISTNSPVTGCMPLIIDFVDLSFTNNSIVSWQWDFGDGGASNLQYPNYDYGNSGNYSVSLLVTDINGCQSLSTKINFVEVYEMPSVDFIADPEFSCNPTELVTFTNNTLGLASYTWDFGDGTVSNLVNPTHNYSAGVYSVSLFAKIGTCFDTLLFNNYIEVGEELNSDFTSDVISGCENLLVNFLDNTNNNPDSWLWEFGDGETSVLQNPSHNYLDQGVYDVTLTTSKGGQCVNTKTVFGAIEVFPKPEIQLSSDTNYGCTLPFPVEFTDQTIHAISWNWDFGNGITSTLENPSALYVNYGNYDVSLKIVNSKGCVKTKIFSNFIEVEKIIINVTASELSGCLPFDINLLGSTNSVRPILDWNWSFGDGNSANIQNPIHQYTTAGLFDLSLSIVNDYGCMENKIFTDFIEVYEIPDADFHASPVISCVGQSIIFSDLSVSNSLITNWLWDFGDGNISNLQHPVHQFQLTDNYDVTLIVGSNSCTDTFVIQNYIDIIEPSASFSENYSCDNPLRVKFENLSIGADNIFWDFGDGNTSNQINPIHNYATKGDYNVSLKVSNNITGCTHESVKPIKLTIPKASFDYLINANNGFEDSIGCAPKTVFIKNNSTDMSYYKVLWSDGYVGHGRVDHLFTSTGQFDVTMIITDIHACKDTFTYDNMYTINDVVADFGIVNVLGCDSMLVDFEDLSSPSSSVFWNFGDGGNSNANDPDHIYYNEGFFDVTLYAESVAGCKDTLERIEYIHFQYPSANFSSNVQDICSSDIVQFSNLSEGVGISSAWDFGDGTQSSQINPSHLFNNNGQFDVILLVTDSFGCSNTTIFSDYIKVQNPTANFVTGNLSSNCPPLISNFNDLSSTDVVSWEWLFGDGGSSTLNNPSHLFSASGIFDVALIVENSIGCRDTVLKNGLISISGPTGTFSISDSLICKGESVFFIPSVVNADNFLWDFGNGMLSTDSFPSLIYATDGEFTPILIIENSSGCQFTINNSDTIKVGFLSIDAGIDVEICEGEQVQLHALGNATQFTWMPALGLNNPNLSNPIATPISDIMYFIKLSDGLCEVIDSVFIKVNNEVPLPTFNSVNHCEGDTIQFSGNSGILSANISWEWSFGSSTQSPLQQLTLGTNAIQLIVINLDNNCSDTIVQQVVIYPLPEAEFVSLEKCLAETSNFINTSSANVVSWEYNMGDGIGISFLENPNYTYTSAGIFYPNLVATSDFGCTDEFMRKVEINELPIADFLVENNCVGEENNFSDISTISNGIISNWEYDFGDGTINGLSSNEHHQYTLAGSYNVTLNVISEKGCVGNIVKETIVFDTPIVDFISEQFCFGTPTYFADYSAISSGSIIKSEWKFGDDIGNSIFKHSSYTYINPGVYSVNLTVTSDFGCLSSLMKDIVIVELPIANFSVDTNICLGDETRFTDQSINVSSSIISWDWNIGDGTVLAIPNPTHKYEYAQNFDVTLSIVSEEGCKHDTTIVNAVKVFNNPSADFSASTYNSTELTSEINFYNKSLGANSYFWNFDNGVTSTKLNPIIDFLDIRAFDVLLRVISDDGCEDEIIKTINITPEFALYTPSAFTPNGDGDNDIFLAKGNGLESFEMQVFDRWGGIVFESSDIEYGWNGLDASDNLIGLGIYLYHISVYDYNGKLWVYNGEINLMR